MRTGGEILSVCANRRVGKMMTLFIFTKLIFSLERCGCFLVHGVW
jgi:hypothetical protein